MSAIRVPTTEQLQLLAAWRSDALFKMPYFASILLAFTPFDEPGSDTMSCDRRLRLYIDFAGVEPKGHEWCVDSLLHECGHIIGNHVERRQLQMGPGSRRQKRVWNIAGDLEINDGLVQAGCLTLADIVPSVFSLPDNKLAEVYYAALTSLQGDGSSQGQQGDGSSQGQQGDGSSQGQQGDGSSLPSDEPWDGCGSVSGGEEAPGEIDDEAGGVGAESGVTPGQVKIIQISTAAAIQDHAAKHPGSVPGTFAEMATAILTPSKTNWRQRLGASVRRSVASVRGNFDSTFARPSRRFPHHEVAPGRRAVFPGRYDPRPAIVVVRDTSGSMDIDGELARATAEIEGIAASLGVRGDELIVLDTDAEVQAIAKFDGRRSIAKASGRGGTNMGAGIAFAEAMRPKPTIVVVITDGFSPWPTTKPGVPVVVVVVGGAARSAASSIPSWAKVVVIDEPEAARR